MEAPERRRTFNPTSKRSETVDQIKNEIITIMWGRMGLTW